MKTPKFLRVNITRSNFKLGGFPAIRWLLLFPFLFSSIINFGQTLQTFNSSGTWLCPTGVTSITVECWRGGGAGGGSITVLAANAGAGGGGGGYTKTTSVSVIPGNTYNVTVGQGGAGNVIFTVTGNNGGPSYFGTTTGLAYGGNGGGGNGGSAGAGGTGGTWNGGNGAAAKDNQNSGGGGGGAGSTSNGGNANQLTPGSGGTGNSSGSGGAGISSNANGNSGNSIGGGGSGAGQSVGLQSWTGGSGANGEVIITNTTPPTITALSSNICAGGSITITGTNFTGITAANITIGGVAVSSITSFTSTQIVAVVNAACTGNVKVTTLNGIATSAGSFTSSALPSATISYGGTPFCKSVGTAQAVTQSGTSGGTYSASPSGLSISTSTGAITPSTSTAGTYIVTYTIPASGGCTVYTTTTSLTVSALSVGGSVGSNATVCSGTNSGTVNLTGQTGNVVNWQYSTNGGTTWTTIANTSASQTYNNLTQTTLYRAVVQNGTCSSANSSAATITVNAVSVGGSVGSNATVCSGTNSGTVNLTGQTGNVVNWQYSTNGGSTWTAIANTSTSQTFTNLTQTTLYSAVVQNGTCSSANSSAATITVNAVSVGGSVGSNATVCSGTNSGTVNLTGQTGNVVNWQYSTNGGTTWTTIANTSASQTYNNLTQTTLYRVVVQSGVCTSANSSAATITVNAIPAAPTVTTPINYCLNEVASQLTATGSNLTWGSGSISGTAGGTTTLSTLTYISNSSSNKETNFTTTASNVEIISVAYYVPAWQSISGVSLALYNSSGTVIATSSTVTTLSNGATGATITNIFNYTIASPGNYSIGIATGTGTIGGDSPSFPITEASGTINVTGTNNLGTAPYHCFNNIQFTVNNGSIAPTPSTSVAGTTNYLVSQTVNGCVSPQATIAVIVNNPPSATISYSGTPYCKSLGTAQSVTLTGTSGGTYSASPSGLSISASTGAITPSSSTAGTCTVTYSMAAAGGCSTQTATTSVTITALPSATISYGGSPFCQSVGTAQAVTQSGTSGGTYSALPSGLSINASTGAITPSSSTAGTYTVTYTIPASGGCSVYTTTINVTVSALSVGGSVGSNATVCSGSNSGTVYLTGQTGSVVNWQYSTDGGTTWTTIVNTTTSQTYNNLTQTTLGRAIVQNGGCSSANSSAATITVNAVSVGGSVGSNATVCSGTNSGTVNLTGQTGNVLNWQYSTDGGTTWTSIANTTTSQTYSNLTQTTLYSAVVQSGVCSSSNSSATTITVNAVSVGGSVGSNATVCSGTNSGTVNLTGQTGNVVNWQYSTNGGSTWTVIGNTTSSQAYSNLTQTTLYSAVVQNGTCSSANSSAATITVNAISVGGSVGSNATVCSGTNSGTVNLTGQTGNVVNWQYSTNGGSTWTAIANTSTSQTYSNLMQTTLYRAVVQSGVCSTANSNNATITVNAVSVGGSVSSNATVCSGSNSGTINLTGQTGSVLNWQYSTDGGTTWTTIANTTTSQTYSNLTQTTQYSAVVQSGVCTSANSSAATITVNSISVGGVVNSNATVCSGSNSGTLNLTGNTGSVVNWQYSTNGGTSWTNIVNTTTSQTYSNITQTTQYRVVVQSGVCTSANSSAATITVNPLSVGGTVNSNATVCTGANSGTVYLTGQTGNVVNWQYSIDGGTSWTNISNVSDSETYSNLAQTTIGRAVVQSGVCASVNSSPDTITVVAPGSWSGTVSTNWNDSRNWLCGQIPTSTINVTIPAGASYYPIITSGIDTANNITIASGGSLTVGSGTLQIFGSISNAGTLDATKGTIEMKGASAQTIDGSAFYQRTINNLIVSNTGTGLSVASTANDTLKITGSLTFGGSTSTLNTGDNITLVSNSAGTASLGIIGSGNTINGQVIVERYINIGTAAGQHAKSWQLLATPTIGQTVKQSWMENGITTSTGYGTQVTGPGGTAAGFDLYTASPSLKYYVPSTDSWTGIANTAIPIYNPNGYFVFIRGDRSVTAYNQPPNNTILRTKGTLLTGTQSPVSVSPDEYGSVGNPYPSPVDFTLITKGAGIDDLFYVWDPYLYGSYGYGGYQTLSSANEWKPVPGGTSAYPSGTPYYILQSGQAIFVHATSVLPYNASDYNLTFSENDKSSSSSTNVSRVNGMAPTTNHESLNVSLYTGNIIADGNTVVFDRSYSDNIDGNDALKILNQGENFGLLRNGKLLAIEARAPASLTDTLYYDMSNLSIKSYQLRFAPSNMSSTGLQAYLIDKFLNTATPVSLTDSSSVNISITSNPASYASNRFEVVFRTLSAMPVTFTSITAVPKNSDILVQWKVENETGIQQYEVEESAEGSQFTKEATVAVNTNGSGNYSWLDENATPGYHYYRVRSVGKDGQIQYTDIVKVLIGNQDASISVYPNPIVNDEVHIQFNNQPGGVYGIRLLNTLGQVIVSKVINHTNGSSTEDLSSDHKLPNGVYQVEITKPNGTVEVVKVVN